MSWQTLHNAPAPGTPLCRSTDIPDGEGKEFVFGYGYHAFRMFIVRRREKVWGYVNRCPHFPVPLNVHSDTFVTADSTFIMCAHHAARFRYADGHCVDGPCKGAALDPVPLRREEKRIVIGEEESRL